MAMTTSPTPPTPNTSAPCAAASPPCAPASELPPHSPALEGPGFVPGPSSFLFSLGGAGILPAGARSADRACFAGPTGRRPAPPILHRTQLPTHPCIALDADRATRLSERHADLCRRAV